MRGFWQILLWMALLAIVLFASAGRLDLPFFWAYLAVLAVGGGAAQRIMSPELQKERLRPGPGGTDRALRFVALPFLLGCLVVAGLDARFGWSDVPVWVQVVGLLGTAAALEVSIAAIRVNPFFSSVVRIQTERAHHLITSGPYARLRHPGYLAALVWMVALPLALGSWWALLPAAGGVALIIRRVVIEDRYLHQNLPGYPEYAARVRYRLLPGVW